MTYYPVIIPTLNRYEHFKNCVESLSNNLYANETELVVGLDYPPSEKYIDGWKKIKDYIPSIKGFKTVTIFEREHNYGSSENSLSLREYALSKYDAYIYSEDDNVFSPCFLDYINSGLKKYKADERVFAICGYSYPMDWGVETDCVFQYQYFSAWGYGCWKNRIEKISNDFANSFFLNCINGKLINLTMAKKSPVNFSNVMGYSFSSKIPLQDITYSFYMFLTNNFVLMPTKTLVSNYGFDGSGEHKLNKYDVDFSNKNRNNTDIVDVLNVKEVFSNKLEELVLVTIPFFSVQRAVLKYFFIKIFGKKYRELIRIIKKK